jgi:hypothetical protein
MSTTCHHILASGALCQSPPLRHRDYCRFHLQQIGRRMKAARARARQQPAVLRLPLLEDLYSVQIALMQLADAIAYQEIDPQHARLLTTVLRLAMQNLKSKQGWDRSSRFQLADTEAAPTVWESFEREHDLPVDLDLSLDPEVAFPPTNEDTSGAPYIPGVGMYGNDDVVRAKVGQLLREAEAPVPGTPAQVTADEVEIMDVYEREGNDAMMRCIAEQQRSRSRRERRTRRLQYEEMARNHNIQRAARKLVEDQRKAEAAASKPQPTSSNAAQALAQGDAEANRKPPQSDTSSQEQTAVAGEL